MPCAAPARPAAVVPEGGACLLCRPPTLPLAFDFAPIPPTPFPSGEGGDQGYFMQGASPLASPGLNPGGAGSAGVSGAHGGHRGLVAGSPCRPCPRRGGRGGCSPCGTWFPCPGGEDHLKRRRRLRRIVPSPPVPPLLGCRHFPWKGGSFGFAPHRRLLARGARMAETVSAANGLMQGCRGRSPRRNKLIVSPFPTGEGGRGDRGQESKLKAG